MESAQKVYTQGVQAVGKLAGPVGDKVGNALGGTFIYFQLVACIDQ
jgi:hypothetical protein